MLDNIIENDFVFNINRPSDDGTIKFSIKQISTGRILTADLNELQIKESLVISSEDITKDNLQIQLRQHIQCDNTIIIPFNAIDKKKVYIHSGYVIIVFDKSVFDEFSTDIKQKIKSQVCSLDTLVSAKSISPFVTYMNGQIFIIDEYCDRSQIGMGQEEFYMWGLKPELVGISFSPILLKCKINIVKLK